MTTAVPSETMAIDVPQRSHLMELPMELHICIRDQLLKDFDLTINELRPLRLVCKTFKDIWSPVVMTNMVLFRTGFISDALDQLRHIVHGNSDASTLAAYTTLTIRHLWCVETERDRWCSDARRLREEGIIPVLIQIMGMLFETLFWSIAFVPLLIYSALTVHPIFWIRNLAELWVTVITYIKRAIPKLRARYYMALIPRKINMRNVSSVRLFIDYECSDWAIYRSTRILLSFPHFTELELHVGNNEDMGYLVRCLEPLKGLHKLTLFPLKITPSRLRCIAALISNNENLTHFDWRPYVSPDFSKLFCDVATTKPLKLQHLSLSRVFTNSDALIPHIRSLTSIELRSEEGNYRWCNSFSRAKIFPPTIKVELLDQNLVTFINSHPGLVSLTIVSTSGLSMEVTSDLVSSLCKALTHHSQTLQRIFFCYRILAFILLHNEENKANFLRSTGNLREFGLETAKPSSPYHYDIAQIHNEQTILSFVAHMSHSLTVIIRVTDKAIFSLHLTFCRKSKSPIIRNLAGRIVYEECEDET